LAAVKLLGDLPPRFAVLGGDDPYLLPLLAMGAHLGILASAHFATARFVELVDSWRDGDVRQARVLGHQLAAMSIRMFAEPNPTVIKAVLHARGRIPSAAVRQPLLAAATETVDVAIRDADAEG
jgi:4-hydroxy-tetrahydrodipicolinate synthase